MKHGSAIGGFNIFSTNGAVPHGLLSAQSGSPVIAQGRADHAKMLAHAAKRRRAAQPPSQNSGYWKSCAPAAVRKATAIRQASGLARLP
jgi:hypothetical protein